MGPIRCPETSVKDYHLTLRNNPKERTSHQHRGGSLKSRVLEEKAVVRMPLCPPQISHGLARDRTRASLVTGSATNHLSHDTTYLRSKQSTLCTNIQFIPHRKTVFLLERPSRWCCLRKQPLLIISQIEHLRKLCGSNAEFVHSTSAVNTATDSI
jgi:hypothetical protein